PFGARRMPGWLRVRRLAGASRMALASMINDRTSWSASFHCRRFLSFPARGLAAGSIEARFTRGPGLPSAMNPVPVVGMLADRSFDGLLEALRVLAMVGFGILALDDFHRRLDLDLVMRAVAFSHDEARHHRRPGGARQARHSITGRRELSEKIDKHAFAHVEVERDADVPVLPQ